MIIPLLLMKLAGAVDKKQATCGQPLQKGKIVNIRVIEHGRMLSISLFVPQTERDLDPLGSDLPKEMDESPAVRDPPFHIFLEAEKDTEIERYR